MFDGDSAAQLDGRLVKQSSVCLKERLKVVRLHFRFIRITYVVTHNFGYVGNFLEGPCASSARKFEAITGL